MGDGISVPLLCLVWGGFLPLIVTFHQEFSGEHKTESSQRVNTGLTVKFIYEETLLKLSNGSGLPVRPLMFMKRLS